MSFNDVPPGATIEYVGTDEFDGEFVAPDELHGPYEFKHVSIHGTLTLNTCFNGRRRLSPDHPANDRDNWRVSA